MSTTEDTTIDVRTVEAPAKETFIDANDLLIELMTRVEACTTEGGKEELRRLIKRITHIRNQSHKKVVD